MDLLKKHLFLILLFLLLSNIVFSQSTQMMTYNIRYGNKWDTENRWDDRKIGIIQLLNEYKPAILGIQEGLEHQVKYIDSCLVSYSFIGAGRDDGKSKGEYCAIYYDTTKYKVLESSTFWLSETPGSVSVGWDAALERICTYGLFEDQHNHEKLWIFNTHFDHIGKVARKNSAQLILKKIDQLNTQNYPIVLMGDFNVTPDEKPAQILTKDLDDALKISKNSLSGPSGTFNGFNSDPIERRIDYFFTHKLNILFYSHINKSLADGKHISDHLPVLISIEELTSTK